MKKKIFGVIAVLAIVAVAAFNVNMGVNSQKTNLSDWSLANVEALAQLTLELQQININKASAFYFPCLDSRGNTTGKQKRSCSYPGSSSCVPSSCK